MLHSITDITPTKGSMRLKPYQYILFNNMVKRDQYYEDNRRTKDRSMPTMQQVIHTDMERIKTNQVYDRKLNRDLNGPKGLNWQCTQELQRLRSDERGVERDLVRLNRDLAKIASSHSISRSPTLSRNQTSRLSSIAEENLPPITTDKPRLILGRSASLHSNRTSSNHLIPIEKRSSINRRNPYNDHLPRYTFQQVIAKTSDDHLFRQQHAQQKRFIEQKLKQFLH